MFIKTCAHKCTFFIVGYTVLINIHFIVRPNVYTRVKGIKISKFNLNARMQFSFKITDLNILFILEMLYNRGSYERNIFFCT